MEVLPILSARDLVREGYRERLGTPLIDKRQLASHYGFSVRWVESQVAKGMPSRMIGGRRRFDLAAVDRWLRASAGGE